MPGYDQRVAEAIARPHAVTSVKAIALAAQRNGQSVAQLAAFTPVDDVVDFKDFGFAGIDP